MKNDKHFYTPNSKFYANFYITYFCNLACKHCLASCNPGRSKDILPISDTVFYINEFKKDHLFSGSVVINGGEPTSAYYHHSNDYLRILYSELLNRNCNIELHTNSVWATSKKADIIWEDLKIIANFNKFDNKLDLSCDEYHNNLKGISESLRVLSGPEFNKEKFRTNILSFKRDPVLKKVQAEALEKYPDFKIEYSIYDKIVKTGEAAKNNIGVKRPFFEYSTEYGAFAYIWSDFMISFYPDRTASIGACYTGRRRVSYVNKDKTLKPWNQLYPEIVKKYIKCYSEDKCNLMSINSLKNCLIPENHR